MRLHYEKLAAAMENGPMKMRVLVDERRWHSWFDYVFEVDGKYYMFRYAEDATECQEGQFTQAEYFGADKDGLVEVQEVEEREVLVIKWIPKVTCNTA